MLHLRKLEIQSLRAGVRRGRETFGSFLLRARRLTDGRALHGAPDLPQDVPFEVGSDMRRGGDGAFFIVGGRKCK